MELPEAGGEAYISIHAPREGSDPSWWLRLPPEPEFQSTLPVRGATGRRQGLGPGLDISIHAPREGSDHFFPRDCDHYSISIHAPREGSDLVYWDKEN